MWLMRILIISLSFLCSVLPRLDGTPVEGAEAIRGSGKTIYLLINGTRHMIPDWSTFLALGLDIDDVHGYSDQKVDAYPLGKNAKDPNAKPEPEPAPPTTDLPQCPCRHSSSHDLSTPEKLKHLVSQLDFFCIVRNKGSDMLADYLPKIEHSNIIYISEDESSEVMNITKTVQDRQEAGDPNCMVVINLTTDEDVKKIQENERRCPGICKPVPYIEMPAKWLLPPYTAVNRALSCSLTLSAVLAHADEGHNVHENHDNVDAVARTMALILRSVARRRMEECLERGSWPLGSFVHHNATSTKDVHSLKHIVWTNHSYLMPHHSKFERRKVFGLVIWVGTNKKLPLLHAQTEMLGFQDPSLPDSERIFGWSATEDQYDCNRNVNALKCPSPYAYHWMMPSSKMMYEYISGWGCAQRRPLRSMSHTLSLYDPEFLFVVDDDTYVNIQMLLPGKQMRDIIKKEFHNSPIVMGQLNGGNKITKNGFFYGGAGYLMGRAVINKLMEFKLPGPDTWGDNIRDIKHLNFLGVMEHTLPMSRKGCPDDCMALDPKIPEVIHWSGNWATLRVPLVDLCTNSFSDEGTCYHSDHALSRCLMHGVYADVWDAKCQGFQTPTDPSLYTQMCMGTNGCNVNAMLTCHRWMPNVSDVVLTPRLIDPPPPKTEENENKDE